jgi:uncharacterized protein (TIGR03084 family)
MGTEGMDGIVDALAAQQAELTALLTPLDGAGWARPTPCEGWDVADVVLHLVQTNEMAIGSAEDRFDAVLGDLLAGAPAAETVDDGAAVMVDIDPGRGDGPAVLDRWLAAADALCTLLRAGEPSTKVTWVAGRLSLRTLATTRLAETWIHTGDVAEALGVNLAPSDRLEPIARLAWRTLPYAFQRAGRTMGGPVAFHLTGPDGQAWAFEPDEPATTVIAGPASDLCGVAGRRLDPAATALSAEGPDGEAVLELVRTYA